MSPSQLARKIKNAYVQSPAVTITIGTVGGVALDSATTSPTSSLFVKALGTYTKICLRSGVTFETDGTVKTQGSCVCNQVVDSLGAPHITARSAAYTIKAGAEGPGPDAATYRVVPINGGAVTQGSTGEIRVGTGS